jgi:hypothetical protein
MGKMSKLLIIVGAVTGVVLVGIVWSRWPGKSSEADTAESVSEPTLPAPEETNGTSFFSKRAQRQASQPVAPILVGQVPVSGSAWTVALPPLSVSTIEINPQAVTKSDTTTAVTSSATPSVSGQAITDYKTGYWLGSTPAAQQKVKFLGVIAASLAARAWSTMYMPPLMPAMMFLMSCATPASAW